MQLKQVLHYYTNFIHKEKMFSQKIKLFTPTPLTALILYKRKIIFYMKNCSNDPFPVI